jgi:hypothetical protein
MKARQVKPTTILTDVEAQEVVGGICAVFGEQFATRAESYGLDPEQVVRFMPVAKRCEKQRCVRGWSIKDVASQLKVPQYRLRDIEGGHVRTIKPEILHAYVSHLDLDSWYRRWKRANPEVAGRVGF